MSDTPFTPAMRKALDRFVPPPPAAGFAERALARVRARDGAPLPPLPRSRRRPSSPWLRAGWVLGSVACLSLVSAAAAATGVFGEPVNVPVLSQIASTLHIVRDRANQRRSDQPRHDRIVAVAHQAEPATGAPAQAAPVDPRQRFDQVLNDPQFRALPPQQRRAELRQTAREMVQSGEARPREVLAGARESLREHAQALPPAQRQQLVQSLERRRAVQQERRLAALPPEQRAQAEQAIEQRREQRQEALAALPPEEQAARREAIRERMMERRARRAQMVQRRNLEALPPVDEGSGMPVR